MGKFDEIKEVLELLEMMTDDDDCPVKVDVVTNREDLDKKLKELEEEGFKLVDDAKNEAEEDEELEKLRKAAKEQHDTIVKVVGKEKADAVVDFASHCAMLTTLIGDGIPLDQGMVDEYNELCEVVHPERCSKLMRRIAYAAMREMAEEGMKDFV